MVVREEGFEVGDLLVDYSAEYISGEEDVGLTEGWYITIEGVYKLVQSPFLTTGEEEVQITTYSSEAIEEELIKYLEQ